MLTKVQSAAVLGLDCRLVEVEADLGRGFPGFTIVGLPDSSIQEAKERIKSAIRNSGLDFPATRRIVVNLAPADIHKEGPAYDLPMALGLLLGQQEKKQTENFDPAAGLLIGELALDGSLRHTSGVLPVALFAKEQGLKTIFVPEANLAEARLVTDLEIIPIKNLTQLWNHILGKEKIAPAEAFDFEKLLTEEDRSAEPDFSLIRGQEYAKRALEIAGAGAHNLLMTGPPGSGKTMLSRAFSSILPKMTLPEVLEVTKLYSIAGLLPAGRPLIRNRPFRTPHHSASAAALVGGGRSPRPGEISLAHRGVLFLDEFPEFSRQVLESLRQPLEDGVITIARAQETLTFPARFTLIGSLNPCPCGYAGDLEKPCLCSPTQVTKYRKKISGPLLDRIDLYVQVNRVKLSELAQTQRGTETSAQIRERVEEARERQNKRFAGLPIKTNAEMTAKEIKKFCRLNDAAQNFLYQAAAQMRLSARAYHRLLKVSRTIADLAGEPEIKINHLAEALQYRPKE